MLENKVALVTGAGRGIGRQIALTLAKEGATVVVNYNGSRERAEGVVAEIENAGGKAEAYGCDVSDFEACQEMINNVINKYGHLDILVNNAGITRDGLIMKMKEEDFDAVLNTNLKGTFHTIRHSARQMLKQKAENHQYFFCFRCYGKCRTGKLCRQQSRSNRPYQDYGKRTGKQRNYRKCCGAGLY